MGADTRPGACEEGYNLVALMVLIAVINIGVAAALPSLSHSMRREKEAELVFRGMQYAEAIRVFQLRTGRYPVSLRELLEINPRCIRQLWTDPFNDNGEWALILAQGAGNRRVAGGGGPGELTEEERRDQDRRPRRLTPTGAQNLQPVERVADPDGGGLPRRGQIVARGPIIGVRSLSTDEGVRSFMGSTKYSEWLFIVNLIPTLAVPALGENVPRLHSEWIGKPFPEGVAVPEGGGTPDDEKLTNPLDRKKGKQGRRESRRRRRKSDG
ncbi:MAG: hypothetical protein OEM62_01585 [Acidobacteriota bacterium]|nr:hypothetical protein [Acidobacteriota bacterium]